MAISRITSTTDANSGTASVSCNVGDLVFLLLLNTGSSTTPLTPSGFSDFSPTAMTGQDSTNGFAMRGVYQIASSGTVSIPSVTDCTSIVAVVYRGAGTPYLSNILGQASTGTSVSWSGVVSYPSPSDWVLTVAVANSITGNLGSHPPNSNTLVAEYKTSIDDAAVYDSNGPLSAYSFNSKTVDASVHWITKTAVINVSAAPTTPTDLFFAAVRP